MIGYRCILKKVAAILLSLCMAFSVIVCIPVLADGEVPTNEAVSRLVQGEKGAYVEYLGKPYLMYGIQMRLDWAYTDKQGDESFIAENFERVVDDGFTNVAIPIYWSQIEPSDGVFDFSRLEMYYKYLNKYDLTVQWLWFGTNVCGGAAEAPTYIKNDSNKYSRVYVPNSPSSVYMDFSCAATLEREKAALAKMMQWLYDNDTDKRCVMIQVNNEVDQGANNFDPYYSAGYTDEEKKYLIGKRWYENPQSHDKYCWAGGQREECFAYLSALGDVIHQSNYNVVTRVNFSGAGREMPEIADDLTDLLALGGIDIIGEDIYYKTWDTITPSFTLVDKNVHHLAENGGNYDSSYNAAKTFEIGGGLIIYAHREDRESNGGSGIYMNTQGATPDYANRANREWTERPTTQAVRNFAHTVGKIYQPLANAVANRDFAEFNGDKADAFTGTKTVGDMDITYSSENNGFGMAFMAGQGDYVITATDTATFTLDTNDTFTAQAGYYVDETWVATDDTVAVDNNTITLTAGQIVRIDFNAYYEFMGEQVAFDLPDGICVSTDAELNGKTVIKNTTADRKTFTLAENLQDFKISYKFHNGSGWGSSGVLAPVLVTTRGTYQFASTYYNPNGDLYFGGGGETQRHQKGGGTSGWHTAEIMMKGDRMVILYDGIVWDSRTLVKGTTSGKLSIGIRYIDTEICDLKVETVTDDDMRVLADSDFTTGANTNFRVSGTYDSAEKAHKITDKYSEYLLNGPYGLGDAQNAVLDNFTFEAEFKFADMVHAQAWQRGILLYMPSGNVVALYGASARASTDYNGLYNGATNNENGINLNDGKYHTVKVISKYGYEQIIVDNTIIATFEVKERVSGHIKWKNFREDGCTYVKKVKIINNIDIAARKQKQISKVDLGVQTDTTPFFNNWSANTWTPEIVDGKPAYTLKEYAGNGNSTLRANTVINDNAWIYHTEFYINDETIFDNETDASRIGKESAFVLRLKKNDTELKHIVLSVYKSQYRVNGNTNISIKGLTVDKDGYVQFSKSIVGRWVSLDVIIIDNYIIVSLDGVKNVFIASKPDAYAGDVMLSDSATIDQIYLPSRANGKISFADVSYQYADELKETVNAIDNIGKVAENSGVAIMNAEEKYSVLGANEKSEIAYFIGRLNIAYNTYDELFTDGDVNENGVVDVIDLIRLKKISAGGADKTIKANVDKDADRVIGALDMAVLKKILLTN